MKYHKREKMKLLFPAAITGLARELYRNCHLGELQDGMYFLEIHESFKPLAVPRLISHLEDSLDIKITETRIIR